MNTLRDISSGAAAGAAGTTALNAATYLDMVARGRGSSSAPEETVEKLAERALRIPGQAQIRENRVSGLAALNGIAAGVLVGTALGAMRAVGWRWGVFGTTALASVAAMGVTDTSMSLLGVTDPRHWSASDWASDLLPHFAYGLVTAATLEGLSPD